LIVDLVVASALASLGMTSLSPAAVSLPIKLLLFVLADGWVLVAHGLVLGYA
jgi:flagellar biosynthesis protein FliP